MENTKQKRQTHAVKDTFLNLIIGKIIMQSIYGYLKNIFFNELKVQKQESCWVHYFVGAVRLRT